MAKMSNLRRNSYSMLVNVRLFRRFWFIVLRWESSIVLRLEMTITLVQLYCAVWVSGELGFSIKCGTANVTFSQ